MDVVQSVINKTISGERNWDPAKGELVPWLKDQIKSELDALANSAAHRREQSIQRAEELAEDRGFSDFDFLGAEGVIQEDAEQPLLEEEDLIISAQITAARLNALFAATDGNEDLEEVYEAIVNGCPQKPKALAKQLNTSVTDINNRLRRMRRRAVKVKEQDG